MTIFNVLLGALVVMFFVTNIVSTVYYIKAKKSQERISTFQLDMDDMKARCPFL